MTARTSRACASTVCVRVQIPVVFVGKVLDNGKTDAGHAALAVVPSSCDDRQLRSAQALLEGCAQGGQRIRREGERNGSRCRSNQTRRQRCSADVQMLR